MKAEKIAVMVDKEREKMKGILDDTHDWPAVYLYKFILEGDNKKIALLESLFSDSAKISTRESSAGKYVSISVREVVLNADEILDKYAEAKKIEGIMVL